MAGYAHIITLGDVVDSAGIRVPQYQFTYTDGSNSYARTFDEASLIEFLNEEVALAPDILNPVLRDLREAGAVNIPDMHISENDAAAMGLEEIPTM